MDVNNILTFTRKSGFHCESEIETEDFIILRINLTNEQDVTNYLRLFESNTFTKWIRNGELPNPKR